MTTSCVSDRRHERSDSSDKISATRRQQLKLTGAQLYANEQRCDCGDSQLGTNVIDYYIGLCLLLERPTPSVALVTSVAAVAAAQATAATRCERPEQPQVILSLLVENAVRLSFTHVGWLVGWLVGLAAGLLKYN